MNKNILRKIPAITIMVTLCILSSLEGNDQLLKTFVFHDKIVHTIAYFVLGIAVCLWIPSKKWAEKPVLYGIITVLICTLFGFFDEVHQSYVPGRSGLFIPGKPGFDNGIWDLVADFIGGLLSPFAYLFVLKLVTRWRAPEP